MFPLTRHSVFERLRAGDTELRRVAFTALVDGYWMPVYRHLRVIRRLSPEDAQDVTQGFFADAMEHGWLERYDPAHAKFRTFIRVCVDRYAMNQQQAASRIKRGGQVLLIPLDDCLEWGDAAALAAPPSAEDFFRDEFVRALFARALEATRAACVAERRELHLTLFERYDLNPAGDVSYASLARDYGVTPAQVTNYLSAVRRMFRAHVLETLRLLCGSDEEYRREARDLLGVEVA